MPRCLSFHATYRCRDSGACCEAGWPIEVEGGKLLPMANGRCAFRDPDRRCCRVHASLGHEALPLACRQFPRVCVIDPRGVSVTLSHFCPTAAAMLETPGPVSIVSGAPAFPDSGEYEGLDTRDALPPLLRPNLLMDWESWWLWEALSVETLVTDGMTPTRGLAILDAAITRLSAWTPGAELLETAVRAAFADAQARAGPRRGQRPDDARLIADVMEAVPDDAPRHGLNETHPETDPRILTRFLAAHAFANWTAHLGGGLHAWLRSLDAAHALARTYGVRRADLFLRHLANPGVLAEIWLEPGSAI